MPPILPTLASRSSDTDIGTLQASATGPKTRGLWGNGAGNYRTTGKYAAASVRGTFWLTQDTCKGTLVRVRSGTVSVLDK
jgi:hypothetical protein